MLLCDIGNTSYHFFDTISNQDYKKSVKDFNPKRINETIYYICVQPDIKILLKEIENWIDISKYLDMKNYYKTMGIDRIIACEAVEKDAVIVDAGSAITVDIVKNGKFNGGFIYPGIDIMTKTYKGISKALNYSFNFDIDLTKLPKNSQDAITYGYLKTLSLEVLSHKLPIILTGGNAKIFHKIFPKSEVDEFIIFRGMKKVKLNNI